MLLQGAWLLWLLALLGGVAYVGVLLGLGTNYSPFCEGHGDSTPGDLRWQSFRPGFYCSWSYTASDGYVGREGVTWRMSTYLITMVGSGAGLVMVQRRLSPRGASSARR